MQWRFRGYKKLKASQRDKAGTYTHITLRCLQGSSVMPLELPWRNGTSKDGGVKEKILYKVVKALKSLALCTTYLLVRRETHHMLPENMDNPAFFIFLLEKIFPLVTINGETSSHLC
jgi:hypothetical protein